MPILRLFPLNTVVFPGQRIPLHIFEPRYRQLVREVLDEDAEFGIALIKQGREAGGGATPVDVGCAVRIVDAYETEDGRWDIVCEGIRRFRITENLGEDPFLRCEVEFLGPPEDAQDEPAQEAARELAEIYGEHLRLILSLQDCWQRDFPVPRSSIALADLVAARLEIPQSVKQELLESPQVARRLEMLVEVLAVENGQLKRRLAGHQRKRVAGLGVLN